MESQTAAQWIRERRRLLKLRRHDLMPATGLALSTLARLESGESANRTTVTAVAKALKLTDDAAEALADWHAGKATFAEFLARYNGTGPFGTRSAEAFLRQRGFELENKRPTVLELPRPEFMVAQDGHSGTPILGEVTAGGMVESMVFESGDEPERIPIFYPHVPRAYALRIRGDSMSPEYRPGEILICRDAIPDDLEDGEDAVIQCDGGNDGCSTFKRCFFLGDGRVRMIALNNAYDALEVKFETIVRIGKILGIYREKRPSKTIR
jgi:SOS-response transcriptional repressor LexA